MMITMIHSFAQVVSLFIGHSGMTDELREMNLRRTSLRFLN
jgi:hypothetical protein